jgi:NADPH:quinone reductase-like Zn-dependent oxidoreductase
MLGLRRPRRRTLGLEFAGVVEDVGSAVTQFAVGGRVFAFARAFPRMSKWARDTRAARSS